MLKQIGLSLYRGCGKLTRETKYFYPCAAHQFFCVFKSGISFKKNLEMFATHVTMHLILFLLVWHIQVEELLTAGGKSKQPATSRGAGAGTRIGSDASCVAECMLCNFLQVARKSRLLNTIFCVFKSVLSFNKILEIRATHVKMHQFF